MVTILFQDPFDPDEFVERMVRRSMQECRLKDDQFDPEMIHDIFTQAIQDLKVGGLAMGGCSQIPRTFTTFF